MQKPSQRDDTQKKLLDFVNDPDNIRKAIESSMEKRNKVMDSQRDKANLDSPSTSRVQVEVRDSNSPEKPDSSNTDTNVGIEEVQDSQRDEAIKHKVWVVAATFIGADDEDHEDDEVIQPLYDAIMHLLLLDRSQRDIAARIDELKRLDFDDVSDRRSSIQFGAIEDRTAQLEALRETK